MSDIQLVQSNFTNIAAQNVNKAFVCFSDYNLPLMFLGVGQIVFINLGNITVCLEGILCLTLSCKILDGIR